VQRHALGALLVLLDRPRRYEIASHPEDPDQPVTTSVTWACGCRATGPSYQELRLAACFAHAATAPGSGRAV
jgi:hypothetical protein